MLFDVDSRRVNSGVRCLLFYNANISNPESLETMDMHSFYEAKTLAAVEWWISYCSEYPELYWARLRVFSDGSADVFFDESKVYGFDSRESASHFLSEDEYIPFDSMNAQDETDIGVKKSDISPPDWWDDTLTEFKYLGTY